VVQVDIAEHLRLLDVFGACADDVHSTPVPVKSLEHVVKRALLTRDDRAIRADHDDVVVGHAWYHSNAPVGQLLARLDTIYGS